MKIEVKHLRKAAKALIAAPFVFVLVIVTQNCSRPSDQSNEEFNHEIQSKLTLIPSANPTPTLVSCSQYARFVTAAGAEHKFYFRNQNSTTADECKSSFLVGSGGPFQSTVVKDVCQSVSNYLGAPVTYYLQFDIDKVTQKIIYGNYACQPPAVGEAPPGSIRCSQYARFVTAAGAEHKFYFRNQNSTTADECKSSFLVGSGGPFQSTVVKDVCQSVSNYLGAPVTYYLQFNINDVTQSITYGDYTCK